MLRSMLTTVQSQKSKIVLLCFVVLAILLFSKLAMKSIWTFHYRTLLLSGFPICS